VCFPSLLLKLSCSTNPTKEKEEECAASLPRPGSPFPGGARWTPTVPRRSCDTPTTCSPPGRPCWVPPPSPRSSSATPTRFLARHWWNARTLLWTSWSRLSIRSRLAQSPDCQFFDSFVLCCVMSVWGCSSLWWWSWLVSVMLFLGSGLGNCCSASNAHFDLYLFASFSFAFFELINNLPPIWAMVIVLLQAQPSQEPAKVVGILKCLTRNNSATQTAG